MLKIMLALLLLATPAMAIAQSPAVTCETQLEEARSINVQLRKAKAQSDFTAASMEEAMTSVQKKIADLEAKSKAAEHKPEPKK
jgi:hypothetical protein